MIQFCILVALTVQGPSIIETEEMRAVTKVPTKVYRCETMSKEELARGVQEGRYIVKKYF